MGSMFSSSPQSLKRQLEKLKKKNLDNTSRYIYLTYVPLNSKGNKYCYSIPQEAKPKKKGLLFRISIFTPVNDYNFKPAMEHIPFASVDDVVYKIIKVSKNYVQLENTETTEIITAVVRKPDDDDSTIKRRLTNIKVTILTNELLDYYCTLDERDAKQFIKEAKDGLKVSKGIDKKILKKFLKEI